MIFDTGEMTLRGVVQLLGRPVEEFSTGTPGKKRVRNELSNVIFADFQYL